MKSTSNLIFLANFLPENIRPREKVGTSINHKKSQSNFPSSKTFHKWPFYCNYTFLLVSVGLLWSMGFFGKGSIEHTRHLFVRFDFLQLERISKNSVCRILCGRSWLRRNFLHLGIFMIFFVNMCKWGQASIINLKIWIIFLRAGKVKRSKKTLITNPFSTFVTFVTFVTLSDLFFFWYFIVESFQLYFWDLCCIKEITSWTSRIYPGKSWMRKNRPWRKINGNSINFMVLLWYSLHFLVYAVFHCFSVNIFSRISSVLQSFARVFSF